MLDCHSVLWNSVRFGKHWIKHNVEGIASRSACRLCIRCEYLSFSTHRARLISVQFSTIFWVGFSHIPGHLREANIGRVPVTKAFYPTQDRSWLIAFWNLETKWVFVAMPFGFLLMLLFYYDHVRIYPTLHRQLADRERRMSAASLPKPANSHSRSPVGFTGTFFSWAALHLSLLFWVFRCPTALCRR